MSRRYLLPLLEAEYQGFPFDADRFVMRDLQNWMNLENNGLEYSPFYERCFVRSSSKKLEGVKVFKKPTKAFQVALVLRVSDWEKVAEWDLKRQVKFWCAGRRGY